MEPKIIEKSEIILAGIDFYGHPYKKQLDGRNRMQSKNFGNDFRVALKPKKIQ